jgi:hypothetical protein
LTILKGWLTSFRWPMAYVGEKILEGDGLQLPHLLAYAGNAHQSLAEQANLAALEMPLPAVPHPAQQLLDVGVDA